MQTHGLGLGLSADAMMAQPTIEALLQRLEQSGLQKPPALSDLIEAHALLAELR
jgi:hypothetical protein